MIAKNLHWTSTKNMRSSLVALEIKNDQYLITKVEKLDKNLEDFNKIWYYQDPTYTSKIIEIKLISMHHNDLLMWYFSINKI